MHEMSDGHISAWDTMACAVRASITYHETTEKGLRATVYVANHPRCLNTQTALFSGFLFRLALVRSIQQPLGQSLFLLFSSLILFLSNL